MTEQEIIMDLIFTAPKYEETREWCPEFNYFKILTQTWENDTHILIRTNTWVETFNCFEEMGGWSLVGCNDVLQTK